MNRLLIRLLPIFALLLLLARPAAAEPQTSGTLRIISCAPNVTEMLYAIGVGDSVIGISSFTTYPPEALKKPAVTDLISPNLEAMLRLRPTDVVVLQSQGKISEFFAKQKGVRVTKMGEIETLAQIDAAMWQLRKTFLSREAQGIAAEKQLATGMVLVTGPMGLAHTFDPKVLLVLGYGAGLTNLTAAGHGTYLSELIGRGGGRNVVPPDAGKYPTLNKEALVRLAPDVILITADEGGGPARIEQVKKDFAPITAIKGLENIRFASIDDPGVLIPGPRALGYTPLFRKAIQPEAKESGAGVPPAD